MNVYDFDNTIYDGESVLDFFFFYLKKNPTLVKFLPKVLHAFAKYKAGKITVDQAMDAYAPLLEGFFLEIDDINADSREFWDKHMKNIKSFYFEIKKPDDVIVTASPELTMREICKRIGVNNCVGSVIDEETGKITRLCLRSKKIPAFLEAFPDAHIDNFYTDSPINDAPLIDLAEHAFIVKKNKITQVK